MSRASLSNGAGPGSSISLAPETIRVRDALIEKFSASPLEDMTNFMTMALSNETDELRRLGILAARIYILRHRVANLKEFNSNPTLKSLPELDTTTLNLSLNTATEPVLTEDMNAPAETTHWSRIQMTEPGEVNGVRFLAGTTIDAQPQDADKLIQSGKAVRVDEDGDVIAHHIEDPKFSAAKANNSDEKAELEADNTAEAQASDEEINLEAPQMVSEANSELEVDQPQEVNKSDAETADDQQKEAETVDETKAATV